MPPRWKPCARDVDRCLGEALGQEFVRRTFSPDTKARAQLMTDQIEPPCSPRSRPSTGWAPPPRKKPFASSTPSATRSATPTSGATTPARDHSRRLLRQRVARPDLEAPAAGKIGKPVDRTEWVMTPPTVNAYYDPQMNDINFPAGVLQPPLYDFKLDDAPNYGNTGSTIGHELTHAFDDEGRQFDAARQPRDWWTQPTPRTSRTASMRRRPVRQVPLVDDIKINSKLTEGRRRRRPRRHAARLHRLEEQTQARRSPPATASPPTSASSSASPSGPARTSAPRTSASTPSPTPTPRASLRINGVVTNLPEFQKAFACKAGQPMVKANVCKVW